MDNETKVGISFNSEVKNLDKINELEEKLRNIYGFVKGINNSEAKNIIQEINKNSKDASKNIKDTKNETSKLSKNLKSMFNIGSVTLFSKALYGLTKNFMQLSQKSTEYIENVNLLEVAYKNQNETIEQSSARIEEYIQKMADVYGLDESRLTRQFGIFKQLANAMQLPTETAENLSEIMVKMTNDIASLYNLDLNRASNALQSALAGQVRPIRSATGADITEKTLQNTVVDLGLDRSISELSYVEKRLIMVISLTNQLKVSQGDYARTIESASNQIRVMHEQWDRLSRAVGNVFYPILEKVLPYINAVLMALTEIFNMLASLFGFKMPEFDYSGLSGVSDLAIDIEDEMNGAGEATDKLASKLKGLRSFDKLNVINTPSAGKTASGGAGGSGYVDPTIMDAFNKAFSEYDDKLESVRMKASKIKDDIMEWLGFEKGIDEETGKIVWKYQGIGKTLKNMWDSFKEANPTVKTIIGYFTFLAGKKIYTAIAKLVSIIGNSGLAKSLKKILEYVKIYKSITGNNIDGLLGGIDSWKKHATMAERLTVAFQGLAVNAVGLVTLKTSFDDINKSGINLFNTLGLVSGAMENILGGAMMGAAIGGGPGAIFGALVGTVETMISAMLNYESELDKVVNKSKNDLKLVQDTASEIAKGIAETEMEITSSMSLTNYHEKLLDELDQVIDSNGKIKSGYEDRASYILNELSSAYGVEYKIIDGVLQEHDKIKSSLKEQIALKEAEIILEAYKEDYIDALKKENELYGDIEKQEKNRNNTLLELNGLLADVGVSYEEYVELQDKLRNKVKLTKEEEEKLNKIEQWKTNNFNSVQGVYFKRYEEAYKNYNKAVDNARENYEKNHLLITRYSDFATAVETGNMELINEKRDLYTRTWVKDGEIITNSEMTEMGKRIESQKSELKEWKTNNDERYESYKNTLLDISKTTDDITPEVVEKWRALGETSKEDFVTEFSKLDDDIQKEIVSQMYQQGVNINSELQRGLNSFELTKTVKTEVDNSKLRQSYQGIADVFSQIGFSAMADKYYTMASRLAIGGMPEVGQLFVANEKGPELVGQIGGQTFVANQNQMMDLLDRKIGNAQNKQPQIFNFYLDADHKIGTYTLDQLQDLAKTNGQAITIG